MQKFDVKGMSCEHCAAAITSAVQVVDPEAKVEVDVPGGIVSVDGQAPAAVLLEAIEAEGYEAKPVED